MSSYHYGKPGKQDWAHVADVFAAHESLKSEKTSSIPLVQFWQDDDGFQDRVNDLQSILGDVGIMKSESMMCFEYGVSVPKGKEFGRGKASMTDLMIITPDHVIAIEAKYTEYLKSEYEPLCSWLKDSKTGKFSENKLKVLAGWLNYIVEFVGVDNMPVKDFAQKDEAKKIPYQLIHRIASACAVAKAKEEKRKKAIVVYQLFYDRGQEKKRDEFSDELYKAVCALGIKDTVKFYVIGVETKYERGNEKPERLNDLFLEMQEKPVYSFGPTSLLKTNQTVNN